MGQGLVARRLLFSYISVLAIFLVAAWYLYGALVKADRESVTDFIAQQQSLVSELNSRLIQQTPESFRSRASNPLFDLKSQRRILGWRLFNAKKQIVRQSSSQLPATESQWRWYFPQADYSGWYLVVYCPDYESLISAEPLFLALVLFAILLMGIFTWQFRWLVSLEEFARYIITGDHRTRLTEKAAASGVISQAMNQLILNNSLLEQEKTELSQQIRKVSYIDDVTGLGNQWFFKAEFEVRLHASAESAGGLLVLVSFNEDASLGDSEREEIATILTGKVKDQHDSVVSRLRDNDFAILLPSESKQKIDRFCKSLISDLRKSVFSRLPGGSVFVAIGISIYQRGFDYFKVMAEADMALRNAQLQGENSWFIYGDSLAEHLKMGSLRWRTLLQKVLSQNKLLLWQQPIFEFTQKAGTDPVMRQVLARIQIREQIVGADVFMPMAVQCGLAVEFDKLIVENLCELPADSENLSTANTIWSIKLFAESVHSEEFRDWLFKKLQQNTAMASRLVLNVHEAQLNQIDETLANWMESVRSLGGKWCVEHFGTLDQNLSYLKCYSLDFIKLDRRVVHQIDQQASQQLMLKSWLVELKHYDITVIADGIESESEKNYLLNAGVHLGQGFWLEPPNPLLTKKAITQGHKTKKIF